VPGRALVDSGAVRSIVSGDMYRRILKNGTKMRYVNETIPNLFSADSSPMEAQDAIDIDVKLGGVTFPFVFIVIERLGFVCILGMDLLNETKAVIDVHSSVLILFEGLTTINMTLNGLHITVSTIATVVIQPFSEAVVAVRPDHKAQKGDYIIEGAPCAALMVARAIVDAKRAKLPCRVLNPTEKPIKLRSGTAINNVRR